MRKYSAIFLVSVALISFHPTASATNKAACAMFMCSYGDGEKSNSDGECSKHMKALKKITKKKHGDFSCSRTKAERLAKLMLCEESPEDLIKKSAEMVGCLRN